MTLRRLDLLERKQRQASEARRNLAFRGSVVELKAALSRIPDARHLLEESVAETHRDPALAIRRMRDNTHRRGLRDTIERFKESPVTFGKLRGPHVPGLAERKKALDLVWRTSGYASTALARRDSL